MDETMRVMTETPRNAETPRRSLQSWITANAVFFDRNQAEIPKSPVDLDTWRLAIDGKVNTAIELDFNTLLDMPKAIAANTMECSGNSRSLLQQKASGNPWTIGGVGNGVWGGVWLRDVLNKAGITASARHVAFEGFDKPLGKAQIQFIRSIPLEKAMSSTLLAYEMNGEPLPLKHGFPLRGLALGWTGANCVKWLRRITLLEHPYEGFFMDKVYRVFAKDQAPETGEVVTGLKCKSIITQPERDAVFLPGEVTILGAAYAGEQDVVTVEVSLDDGATWQPAELFGPHEPYAWRQWQFVHSFDNPGTYTVLSRATDSSGRIQPMQADWNKLGYGNNGVREHSISFKIE